MIINRLGNRQLAALDMYVFDIAQVEWRNLQEEPQFPGTVEGAVLTIDDGKGDLAVDMLTEAANDSENDRELSLALSNLAIRVRKSIPRRIVKVIVTFYKWLDERLETRTEEWERGPVRDGVDYLLIPGSTIEIPVTADGTIALEEESRKSLRMYPDIAGQGARLVEAA